MEAHKALKAKMTIHQNKTDIKKFTHDEKDLMIEQLADMVANHVEFQGMDAEFYLPDPQDPSCLCYIFQEDSEFTPTWVVNYFCSHGMTAPP